MGRDVAEHVPADGLRLEQQMKKRAPIKSIVQLGHTLRDALLVNAGGTPPPVTQAATELLQAIGVVETQKPEVAKCI